VIPAGGSGKLVAKVHTSPMQNGKLTKSISVNTDAKGAENLSLAMTFTVQPAIDVKPKFQVMVDTVKGVAKSERSILHRTDGKPLKVDKVDIDDPAVAHVTFGAVTEPGDNGAMPGDAWVEVAVAAADSVANQQTKLHIHTDHPDQAVLDLPLGVRVRPLVEARPERVQLWIDENAPGGRTTVIKVASNRDKPFEIKEIVSSNPDVFTAKPTTNGSLALQSVQVELTDKVTATSLVATVSGTLRVTTSDPDQPLVEVPVVVSKRVRSLPPRPAEPGGPTAMPPSAPGTPQPGPKLPPTAGVSAPKAPAAPNPAPSPAPGK
jgi:hypothetical protein